VLKIYLFSGNDNKSFFGLKSELMF